MPFLGGYVSFLEGSAIIMLFLGVKVHQKQQEERVDCSRLSNMISCIRPEGIFHFSLLNIHPVVSKRSEVPPKFFKEYGCQDPLEPPPNKYVSYACHFLWMTYP